MLRNAVKDIITLPQALEKSDNPNVKAASRIGQKLALKQTRRFMKKRERKHFRADPSYDSWDFYDKLNEIHNYGSSEPIEDSEGYLLGYEPGFDYEMDSLRDSTLGDKDDEGEDPVPIMGNSEIVVNDEGSIKANLPRLYERWIGKWPFKSKKDTDLFKPRYKYDIHARLGFDMEHLIDTYRLEVGVTRYSSVFREKQWRLSVYTKYESDNGNWAVFVRWAIPW